MANNNHFIDVGGKFNNKMIDIHKGSNFQVYGKGLTLHLFYCFTINIFLMLNQSFYLFNRNDKNFPPMIAFLFYLFHFFLHQPCQLPRKTNNEGIPHLVRHHLYCCLQFFTKTAARIGYSRNDLVYTPNT